MAPLHDGKQQGGAGAADRGHGGGASASMPALSGRGGPTGDNEQSDGPANPGAVGKQQMGHPGAAPGGPAGGQLGPGHLLRALMLKGMKG